MGGPKSFISVYANEKTKVLLPNVRMRTSLSNKPRLKPSIKDCLCEAMFVRKSMDGKLQDNLMDKYPLGRKGPAGVFASMRPQDRKHFRTIDWGTRTQTECEPVHVSQMGKSIRGPSYAQTMLTITS